MLPLQLKPTVLGYRSLRNIQVKIEKPSLRHALPEWSVIQGLWSTKCSLPYDFWAAVNCEWDHHYTKMSLDGMDYLIGYYVYIECAYISIYIYTLHYFIVCKVLYILIWIIIENRYILIIGPISCFISSTTPTLSVPRCAAGASTGAVCAAWGSASPGKVACLGRPTRCTTHGVSWV